jgi:hypothetical protein
MINRFVLVRGHAMRRLVGAVLYPMSVDPLLLCFWNGKQEVFKVSDVEWVEPAVVWD